MILQDIHQYVLEAGRVEEPVLLTHFHLQEAGLAALMAPLLKRGKIQKTVHQRGENLPAIIYYSCPKISQIPTLTIV